MNQYTITDEQAEHTRVAYSIIAGIPKSRMNLDTWRAKRNRRRIPGVECSLDDSQLMHTCDSVGCIAGWLSAHPYFTALGLHYERRADGARHIVFGYQLSTTSAATTLFGNNFLFAGRTNPEVSNKREALARLRLHLFAAGRITTERNTELDKYEARIS